MNSLLQQSEILRERQAGAGHSGWGAIISIAILLSGVLWLGAMGATCRAADVTPLRDRGAEPPRLRSRAPQPPIPVPLPGQNVVQFYNQSSCCSARLGRPR
jgi:hypothetical protein